MIRASEGLVGSAAAVSVVDGAFDAHIELLRRRVAMMMEG